jgi:hypothetical protein
LFFFNAGPYPHNSGAGKDMSVGGCRVRLGLRTLSGALAILAGLPFVVRPLAAQSDVPPHYDAEAYCKEVANLGGNYSAFMDNACLDQEQKAYDGLKAKWSDLPAEARTYCDEIALFGGKGSYFMLNACIEQEMRARTSRPKFQH